MKSRPVLACGAWIRHSTNGATLWFPNVTGEPERFEWKGSHLSASFSPDGRFLVTAMQESMLHGWRVIDRKDMRMQGYAERVRSLGASAYLKKPVDRAALLSAIESASL